MRRWLLAATALVTALSPRLARAGEFDGLGEYHPDSKAIAYVGFEAEPDRYLPSDADPTCMDPMFTSVLADDAVDGKGYVK